MKALDILMMILRAMGMGGLADQIQKDTADGKITVQEGLGLAEQVTTTAEGYFPAESAELELAHDLAVAVDKYMTKKAATAPPAPAPPAPAPSPSPLPPGAPRKV